MKLIDAHGPFFKGNLHTHTTRSDGRRTPEEAMRLYRDHAYDFLLISDHWRSHPVQDFEGMLVMCGTEFDFRMGEEVVHVVGVFPDEDAAQGFAREMEPEQIIEGINAGGGAAILAHPAWSLNSPDFIAGLPGVCAAEVYNSFSGEPVNAPRADSGHVLDLAAKAGRILPQVAADDSHLYQGEECRSWVMLQAETCTPGALIDGLKRGAFYASQGPQILEAELTDTQLILRTSPVCRCCFISNLQWVRNRCITGENMTEHIYSLQKAAGEAWVRCEITDENGCKAWLSPVKL